MLLKSCWSAYPNLRNLRTKMALLKEQGDHVSDGRGGKCSPHTPRRCVWYICRKKIKNKKDRKSVV